MSSKYRHGKHFASFSKTWMVARVFLDLVRLASIFSMQPLVVQDANVPFQVDTESKQCCDDFVVGACPHFVDSFAAEAKPMLVE